VLAIVVAIDTRASVGSIDVSISGAFMLNFLIQSALIGQAACILKLGSVIEQRFKLLLAKTPFERAKAKLAPYVPL
jgi:uncharacterized protein YrrD